MGDGKNQIKIAAIVVTYNRLSLLRECISSLKNQTHKLNEIIIVNNSSTDGTLDWLIAQQGITIITQPNIGSSGGQYTGIKTAYEKGYDWIWCMDDDSIPEPITLKKLNEFIEEKYYAISPVVKNSNGEICYDHRGRFDFKNISPIRIQTALTKKDYERKTVEIDFTSFVGSLFSRLAVEKIGLPNKDFFLHHDDSEYCLRLNQFGKALLVTSCYIIHKEDARKTFSRERKFFWKISYRMPFEKFWLSYYSNRNYFWLLKKYSLNTLSLNLLSIVRLFLIIRRILLYDDNKIKRIGLTLISMKHGLNDYFDNDFPKKYLYGNKS